MFKWQGMKYIYWVKQEEVSALLTLMKTLSCSEIYGKF